MKLGIVGHGFVGTAVDHGFTRDIQKFIVDPKHNNTNKTQNGSNTVTQKLVMVITERYDVPWQEVAIRMVKLKNNDLNKLA